MDKLLGAIAALVFLLPPEKVQAIASRIRRTEPGMAANGLSGIVSTPGAAGAVHQLVSEWQTSGISSDEVASMLMAASYVSTKVGAMQSTELVWTGPTTPFVSTRRTEQALLQVINAANRTLFVTSFVAYDISSIVKALNDASDRGTSISMLLELSQDHGGNITFDAIGKMKALVPSARIYAWRDKAESFSNGRVHAKVAVADGAMCFITSANLTGYAMEKNMEAGVLISGGHIPSILNEHLRSLVDTRVIAEV